MKVARISAEEMRWTLESELTQDRLLQLEKPGRGKILLVSDD
jgi:hypothetical protein